MKSFGLLLIAALVGCTQHNPAVCCNTPTQCNEAGLDQMYGCDPGKVCDSKGACVAAMCLSSAECMASDAPYCAANGLCAANCVDDSECPGGGQDANLTHCVMGACVECAMSIDCPVSAPVCDAAACRTCRANSECASELCGSDGVCVATTDIAYASPTGVATGNCDQDNPCTLDHAIALTRPFTAVRPGLYTQAANVTIGSSATIIGVGNAKPTITRSTPGPVITLAINAHVHVENVQISGATNTSTTIVDGDGILCPNDQNPRTLELVDVIATGNMNNGVYANSCTLTVQRSTFTRNTYDGIYVKDHDLVADRCDFSANGRYGLEFDGFIFKVSNSFLTGNQKGGMLSSGQGDGAYLRFSTIVNNNLKGVDIQQAGTWTVSDNLFAANLGPALTCQTTCMMTGNITLGADTSTAHFKNSNAADYHITAGSVAIDAATTATEDHDFDGDVRPKGNGRDVGADEAL